VAAIGPIIFTSRSEILGYEPFRVRSTSMSPTLEQDEFFVADTWVYRHHAVRVGDIVIVERPENPGVKYVKRVVAIAGDSVELRDGVFYRNGVAVDEPYLHLPLPYKGNPRNVALSTLGPGQFYVLGDFRDNSLDSRQWGPFKTSSLRGRVQYIWWSFADSRVQWQRIGTSFVPD
jgi:signal peptidase I